MNLGVLASHEGTTLQSLIDAFARGRIPGRVSVVVSTSFDAQGGAPFISGYGERSSFFPRGVE
jgi:folate-dependent phosphoribosylglycinamide formyltransferase PurN